MKLTFKPGIIIHRKIAWLLLFSIFTLALVGWLIYKSERNIEQMNLTINQTYEIIGKEQEIVTRVEESGTGAWHYLMNDDKEAIGRLGASRAQLDLDLDILQRLSRDNHDRQEYVGLLRNYFRQQQSLEDSLYRSIAGNTERIAAAHRIINLNNTITTFLITMIREEGRLLAIRKSLDEAATRRAAWWLVAGRVASFLFVVIVLGKINRDITRRKQTQERLVAAILEAQKARQMQEQFLANMSHEIRTPMNGIKGMTDLLLGTPLSDKQHELAGIIKHSAGNLLVIINDILDFSKIQAGKLNIEKIDFSLKDVLNNSIALFEHRLKKKGLTLYKEIDPAIPNRLSGDPHRLNQVLINLLGNAIKFTDKGNIRIQVALQRQSEDDVVLAFTVTDTGIGIPADSLPYIFDSFSQAGREVTRLYGGTGLGLTICKQLLHLQRGDITAASTIGEGSVFSFYLPYGYGSLLKAEHPPAEAVFDYSNLLAGKRFLVAEDNEINQKLIDYVLRKAGGTVELVNNGVEAIQHLQSDKLFDLIIMDLQMPEMDGYTATRYIRNDLHIRTPIIAMTATAMKGEHLQCLESGMNEYMTKPFEFGELYKRISYLLS